MKNKYLIIKSHKLSEKDKNESQKILARSARHYLLLVPLKTHGTATWRSYLTFKLKKSLEISIYLGGKDINFGFGGGEKILILCKIYTPGKFRRHNACKSTYFLFFRNSV